MLIQLAVISGSMILAGVKSYQQRYHNDKKIGIKPNKKNTSPQAPIAALVKRADQLCQSFIQRKVDPLLIGKSRHQQMTSLTDLGDKSKVMTSDEFDQRTNRFISLSAASMSLAILGTLLFIPLILPAMLLGMCLLFPMYQRMMKELFVDRKVTMSLLASLYLSGFWLAGYFVFAGFATLLYYFGIKIVHQMEGKSQENLTNLFGEQPRTVWKLIDEIECETPVSELVAGDVVVVNAGECLPVDGMVVDGCGSVDQHMLTGESQPVDKEAGDSVLSATMLLSGRLFVRVDKTGEDTLSANVINILNETTHYQSETDMEAQTLANKTVLPNLALGLLALPLVGLTGAVAVLGAGFGFNLRMVSLLTTVNYLTLASRNNVLIKDGRVLERLRSVDTMVFDKTGTLTLEQPHVVHIYVMQEGISTHELLTFAATAEHRQTHPIAQAIIAEAEVQNITIKNIDAASYEVGYGIKVQIENKLIRVGSCRFMSKEGLTLPAQLNELQNNASENGYNLVCVAIDNVVAGILELHATLRPEAKEVIADLHKRKITTIIISGDHLEPTQKLAADLGIDHYFSSVLPKDKATLIKQLQDEGQTVCFIGDGINDAIALKQADVSISLSGATTVAIDTAQVVLMDKSLKHLDSLIELSHEFDRSAHAGRMTTLVPGAICVGGVFFAGFGIYAAEVLFQIGFFSGMAVAMKPLLKKKLGRGRYEHK